MPDEDVNVLKPGLEENLVPEPPGKFGNPDEENAPGIPPPNGLPPLLGGGAPFFRPVLGFIRIGLLSSTRYHS